MWFYIYFFANLYFVVSKVLMNALAKSVTRAMEAIVTTLVTVQLMRVRGESAKN